MKQIQSKWDRMYWYKVWHVLLSFVPGLLFQQAAVWYSDQDLIPEKYESPRYFQQA